MLCKSCLKEIFNNFLDNGFEEDLLILKALSEHKTLNKEQISLHTKMTISKRRDALSRLLGASLIECKKVGSSAMFSLSDSGAMLLKMLRNNEMEY